jgi:acyl transferase domain-containing protein/acyl carrier protein
VVYVETHGTGTLLGDPIEARALAAALRPDGAAAPPLLLGSVKSNLGHLETAAGIAGLIKAVLVLQKGEVPRSLHCSELNPHIAWSDLALAVAQRSQPLPVGGYVGVSSFGFSGTNAHLVLAAASARSTSEPEALPLQAVVLPLSARSASTLVDLVRAWAGFLEHTTEPLAAIVHTASLRRTHYPYRLVTSGRSNAGLAAQLRAWLAEGAHERVRTGETRTEKRPKVAFVFSGLGGQWPGMALDLIEQMPAFRDAWLRCEAALRPHLDRSATELLQQSKSDQADLDDVSSVPLLVFAIQVALAAQWKDWGVEPGAVVGHSMGEIAAAHVVGALSLDDAVRIMVARCRVLGALEGQGGMLAVGVSEQEAVGLIGDFGGRLAVAAVNSRSSTVLSGDTSALEEAAALFKRSNTFHRWIQIRSPAHSPLIDAHLPRFVAAIEGVATGAPNVRFYSTSHGRYMDDAAFDAAYWCRNLRHTVRFADAVDALCAEGYDFFVELGPHAVLCAAIESQIEMIGSAGQVVPSLRRDADGPASLLLALGAVYAAGGAVDWRRLGDGRGTVIDVPAQPWRRESYWPRLKGAGPLPSSAKQDFIYRVDWRSVQETAVRADVAGEWVLLPDQGGVALALAGRLRTVGAQVHVAAAGTVALNPWTSARGIVDLRPLDAVEPGATTRGVKQARALLSDVLTTRAPRRVWVVTAGGQALDAATPVHAAMSSIIGFGVVASLEHPELWGVSCDIDPAADVEEKADQVRDALTYGIDEDQVAYRQGRRLVPRLVPGSSEATLGPLDASASYLITGGLGGLGLQLAAWLVDKGARRLVLVGRSSPDEPRRRTIDALRRRGVSVEVHAFDIAETARLTDLFDAARRAGAPVRGIIHAAGVTLPARIVDLDDAMIDDVMRPKVAGALALHEASKGSSVDFFVLLSSGAGVWGGEGQAHYAAANRFLNGLAAERRRLGLVASAIDLGWVADSGMVNEVAARYYETVGLKPVAVADACAALAAAISRDANSSVVARFDVAKFRMIMEARRRRPLLAEMGGAETDALETRSAEEPTIVRELVLASVTERRRRIVDLVVASVSAVMGFDRLESSDRDTGFFELGMDSVMAVRLRGRLEQLLGRKLPTTLAFEHPTVVKLAEFLDGIIVPGPDTGTTQAAAVVDLTAEIAELSDAEIDRRLAARKYAP